MILGGGYQYFDAYAQSTTEDPIAYTECVRQNTTNLVEVWQQNKAEAKVNHAFVRNRTQLMAVDTTHTEYLFGKFTISKVAPWLLVKYKNVTGQWDEAHDNVPKHNLVSHV